MAHQLTLSDERYQTVVELAAAHGQTPEELLATLVDEAWERACAPYDEAFANDPDWVGGAREAIAEVQAGKVTHFSSTTEFFQHLGATQVQLDDARRRDGSTEKSPNAHA